MKDSGNDRRKVREKESGGKGKEKARNKGRRKERRA